MGNLAVVAIPEEQDRVWKISSEKAPHLTLLFLGDAEGNPNVQQIMQFVQHATELSEHGPFYLDVDRRGTLGDDEADVIFFNKRSWNLKWVQQFRHQLLQNGSIREAYESTEQYPDWLPHLTLGYPATPANEPDEDRHLYSVAFDRIAVWTGDYEGPDFRLEWPDREIDGELAVAYSVAQKAALMHYGAKENEMGQTAEGERFVLKHHGVKGMRWGVRRDRQGRDRLQPEGHSVEGDIARAMLLPPGTNIPAQIRLGKRAVRGTKAYLEKRNTPEEKAKREKRKLARRDFYWESHTYSDISHADVHNKVADEIDTKVFQLQTAPKYRGKNLRTDKKLQDEYDQDVAKVTDSAYRRAVKDTFGTNPSGTKSAHYVNDVRGARIEIRDNKSGKSLHETSLRNATDDVRDEDTVGHTALMHAAVGEDTNPDLIISVKLNAQGFIDQVGRVAIPGEDDAAHSQQLTQLGEAWLSHYGIKGMRWGVRNRRGVPVAVTPKATTKIPHGNRRKTKIKVEGGENHDAAPEAVAVAKTKAKLQKSGTAALSNKELVELQNRLNLENNVTRLVKEQTRVNKGRKFVRNVTGFNREINTSVDTGLQSVRLAKQVG